MASPTSNWQFAFNGWLFGGPGAAVQVLRVEGLEDLPDLRSQDSDRGFSDGMFSGNDFLGGRAITFTLSITGNSMAAMQTALGELKANMQFQRNGTGVLQLYIPTRAVQRIGARVRRRSIPVDVAYSQGQVQATIQLFCPDPRVYDDTASTGLLTPGSNVGRVYNRVYPLVYASCGRHHRLSRVPEHWQRDRVADVHDHRATDEPAGHQRHHGAGHQDQRHAVRS